MVRLWMCGPLSVRISGSVAERISGRLCALGCCFPREFARKPRGLYDFRMWKATEFRTFMLYTGPIVLRGLVSNDMYNLFLCFSCAMTILLCPDFAVRYSGFAKELLCTFVKNFAELFGSQFVVYNVHSLIHLSEDAEIHGALDSISCFPFENHLQSLKKVVRRPSNPLSQVINRLGEQSNSRTKPQRVTRESEATISLGKRRTNGPIPDGIVGDFSQHHQCQGKFFISAKDGDNCFLLNGATVILVSNILQVSGDVYVAAMKYAECRPFYTYPFNSDRIGVLVVSQLIQDLEVFPVSALNAGRKCVKANMADDSHIIIPILHD